MHDPMTLAFEIKLPIPQRCKWRDKTGPRWGLHVARRTNPENRGQRVYAWWRPAGYTLKVAGRAYGMRRFIDVWHVEPKGHDSGAVCRHYQPATEVARWKVRVYPWLRRGHNDESKWVWSTAWKWHVHHWRIRVIPWQTFTRWARSRCAGCGRRFHWGEAPTSSQWDSDGPSLRKGEKGVYHHRCANARSTDRRLATVSESYVRMLRRFQGILDWSDEDLLAVVHQWPANPDGYGIAADSHVVADLLGWKFDHDADGYTLTKDGRSTRPHSHPAPEAVKR